MRNTKRNSSSLKYEVANLGMKQNPQYINLGTNCSPAEKETFIKNFKEYKDVFAWTYDDLKTHDMKIIQHIIPFNEHSKPFQYKL